jgi:hypothetical protein
MVSTQQLLIGAAALAFLVPERVGAAGTATGTFGTGLAQGITALGTIRISPEFAPNISPRLVPEVGLKTDFPDWLDVGSIFPRIVTGTTTTRNGVVVDPEGEEVVGNGGIRDRPAEQAAREAEANEGSDAHGN